MATKDQTLTAQVTSAVELTAKEKEEMISILVKMTGQSSITLETEVDQDILGGLRVVVGDWVLDTTISSQLIKLSEALKRSA